MINTVHEDDFVAWYRIPDPIEEISISDFEWDEDDLVARYRVPDPIGEISISDFEWG